MRRKDEYFALEIDSSDEDLMGSVPIFRKGSIEYKLNKHWTPRNSVEISKLKD